MWQEYSTLARRLEGFSVAQTLRDTAQDINDARELMRAHGETVQLPRPQGMDRGAHPGSEGRAPATPSRPGRPTTRVPQKEAVNI